MRGALWVTQSLVTLSILFSLAAPAATVNDSARQWRDFAQRPSAPARKTASRLSHFAPVDQGPNFDIPVTYNSKVKWWINYYQTGGRKWFRLWMERANAYLPRMQAQLRDRGLPQDLAFVAMIESGFSPRAVSTADAVGYWQFIGPTASRYGLRMTWWLDERRDFTKSTTAAARYLGDLFRMFRTWYLTAAAYNMGEGKLRRLIDKYDTRNFWELSQQADFPQETREYIPKLLAAMFIAKAPKLYGFDQLNLHSLNDFEYFFVPGGTDLINLARSIGVPSDELVELNPELTKAFVPGTVRNHRIRIPKGYATRVSSYLRTE